MSNHSRLTGLISKIFQKIFELKEVKDFEIGQPHQFLIVRQHNQFGDLLASTPLFRAIKEKFPTAEITVIVSPENYYAVTKNKNIDRCIIFNKKKLISPIYFVKLLSVLRKGYDIAVVPVTVSMSFTSMLICRISKSKIRIGPAMLNGKDNKYKYLFDRRVKMDWRKTPDIHVADFGLEIVRPFGIKTNNLKASIDFENEDIEKAKNFISELSKNNELLIGLHVGAGKPPNRWNSGNFINLIHNLDNNYNVKFYLTGSGSDEDDINEITNKLDLEIGFFIDRTIPEVAALISLSDLFITNDTGIMHVAGATETPQISIFGPTNPHNWAPLGTGKYFLKKSGDINDNSLNDVYEKCKLILNKLLLERKV